MTTTVDAIAARQRLVDDRHYRYRGCAPDPEAPGMSAGDPEVPLDAWGPYTGDGAEAQKTRLDRERSALTICGRCPVLALCRTYANTTTTETDATGRQVEHLVEPEGVLGGELALTRHRALIARRHDTVTADTARPGTAGDMVEARTPQRRALLLALARETDPERVAALAGMDVRTANWHRSALVGMLGLDRDRATRDQLLTVAVENRLIPRSTRIRPDGPWAYAAAPTADGVRQRRIAPRRPVQLVLPALEDMPRRPRPAPEVRVVPSRPRPAARTGATPVQLRLVLLTPTTTAAAYTPAPARGVRRPVTTPSTVLEPAA
ncbi:fibroblast growth factor receptor-like protein [Streptomyces phage ZL12]|uniref:Fibroblast growth factor receptor-like protein n=1 Tax=Streptomyces phage ZL12 TaxID=2570911 RepID=D0UWC9_9CAUD|nr:fibroblast growth factor receptor-like protein [Streptomyces phage ZL12]ACX71101.1 fibroblast growth factor receptor-like protein [Streptomyces phage ZL12]